MSDQREMRRLEAAMQAWLQFRAGSEDSTEEFLSRHEELRDLLEPMVDGHGDDRDPHENERVLGDFRLLREIGRGGMGVVFEARQISLDRRVAVKVLRTDQTENPKAVVRFKREAMTAARLAHRGIVDVYVVGETSGLYWFAMEFVEGQPLDEVAAGLREQSPDLYVRSVVEIVASVADALEHAHRAGVVHRDVKPSNILVRDDDGEPVLGDFGLAREQGLPSVTHSGEFAGTPYYVSPEQARAPRAGVDHRSDVFSLGVTLFELITKRLPFEGESSQDVLQQIITCEPADPRKLNPDLPADLTAVVLMALEKEPGDRYQSAGDFAADLRRFLSHRPVRAKPATRLRRVSRWMRREPLKAGSVAALATIVPLLVALAVYVWKTGPATRVGNAAMRIDRVEELFLEATMSRFSTTPEVATEKVMEAVALAPDDPHVIGVAAQYLAGLDDGPARALDLLDAHRADVGSEPGIRRIEESMLRRSDRTEEADRIAATLGPPSTDLDCYVVGCSKMLAWHGGEEGAVDRALTLLQRAVMLAPKPRSMYYTRLKGAAIAAGEKATEKNASEALARLWPRSAVAWLHLGLALKDDDVDRAIEATERSFEIEPDSFVGLSLMSELAAKTGDVVRAEELSERMRTLYPKQMRFLEGGHNGPHGR